MRELFCEHLKQFEKSLFWLERSLKRVEEIEDPLEEEDIEKLETLAARFSRSVDILTNKLLRALDIVEAEPLQRRLDTLIRAEKRGFVDDYEELLDLKNLRNELAHEYIEELFLEKIFVIKDEAKKLFKIAKKIKEYVVIYNYCKEE